jgi:hypothetical protein
MVQGAEVKGFILVQRVYSVGSWVQNFGFSGFRVFGVLALGLGFGIWNAFGFGVWRYDISRGDMQWGIAIA